MKEPDKTKISITDNGIGIREEMKWLIMSGTRNEKSDVSRGLGIGLTLVHHIIEKVNGTIIPENNEPGDYIKATKVNILLQ